MEPSREAEKILELVGGKSVSGIVRNSKNEILITFNDKTRLFINKADDGLDISIT